MVGEADPGFTVYSGEMFGKSQSEESVEPLVVLMEQLDDEILCITVDGGTVGDYQLLFPGRYWGGDCDQLMTMVIDIYAVLV